jgi:hypothetical protein
LIGCPTVFFFAGRFTDVFFFSLLILDQIESPTAAVILRLYSDNGTDDLHARGLTPCHRACLGRLRGLYDRLPRPLAGCCACRGRLLRQPC